MIAIRLPNLSDRMGRPVFALAETAPWVEAAELMLPEDSVVLDVPRPPATLMLQMPEEIDNVSWNEWLDRVLAEAIESPRMSVDDLEIRGPDRDILSRALLQLWAWFPEHLEDCPAPEITKAGSHCPHHPSLPNKTLRGVLQVVSTRLRIPAHELLTWRFDELMLSYRILMPMTDQTALEDLNG